MKRLAATLVWSLALAAPAAAFTADDMVDTPHEFSQFWSDFAIQAYSCTNEFEATLKIVQFDGALDYFPRVARGIRGGGPPVVLETSSFSKPMDTLIVSEGMATAISVVAGRSLIGISEDTMSHFSAGHYTALTTYPKYNAANVGGPNFMRHRLMQGGDVEISGIVLDKQSGQLSALVLQNQAEAGQRPWFAAYEEQYACQPVAKEELKSVAADAVHTVIMSMADIRDAAAQSVQGQKPETRSLPKKGPKRRLTATVSASEAEPKQIFQWPDAYVSELSERSRFALTCKDARENAVRIVMFNATLTGFPLLRIEHNEKELRQARIYNQDRLTVTTQLGAIMSVWKHEKNALVIIDDKAGDEIFPAGLTFVVELETHDTYYEASRGTPLRNGGELPTAMLPPITTYPDEGALHFSLDRILIDRATVNTRIWMSWPLAPHTLIKYTCTVTDNPQQDAAGMIRESFEAIKVERKRITKTGTNNRL